MEWYDQQVSRLSVPIESRRVTVSAGETHILVSGPAKAVPLFVLHGMNMNAATMSTAISQLSAIRRVYAVDIIGMPGKSVGTRPSRKGNGYPHWLHEVMEALGVAQADFIGHSFGGWLTLKLAAFMPNRIRTAVLLDSGGFTPFTLRGQATAGAGALRYIARPSEKNLLRLTKPFYAPQITPEPCFAEFLGLSFQHTRLDVDLTGLPTLSREDLTGFHAPVFVSYGEYDIFFKARRAIRKAEENLPGSIETDLVKGQGHKFTETAERDFYERAGIFLKNAA